MLRPIIVITLVLLTIVSCKYNRDMREWQEWRNSAQTEHQLNFS